jgi:hypothetical protein
MKRNKKRKEKKRKLHKRSKIFEREIKLGKTETWIKRFQE